MVFANFGFAALARYVHLNDVPLDAHGKCFQIAGNWRTKSFPSLDFEATAMKGAFDDLALQPAVAKQALCVGVDVVCCLNLSFDVVERHVEVAGLHAKNAIRSD